MVILTLLRAKFGIFFPLEGHFGPQEGQNDHFWPSRADFGPPDPKMAPHPYLTREKRFGHSEKKGT